MTTRNRATRYLRRLIAVASAAIAPGCMILSGSVNPFSSSPKPLVEHEVSGSGRERIALVDISGEITSEARGSTFGLKIQESTLARVEASLRKAGDDDHVRAVILRINSPGGSVTASDILYNLIKRFRTESRIPVIAAIHDFGASGAYYAALGADEIVAHPTSVIGSIGVVLQSVSVAGLMKKIGVRNQSTTSGAMKDIGSPLEEMADDERVVLQSVVDDLFDRFVALVRENRTRLTKEMDVQMRDGRIFSANQALAGGLIDRIEYLDTTIERTKQRAGLSNATVVTYREPDEYVRGIHSQAGPLQVQLNLLNLESAFTPTTPRLLYQWLP